MAAAAIVAGIAAAAAGAAAVEYQALAPFYAGTSVASIAGGDPSGRADVAFFASPVNNLFDFGTPVPDNAVYRVNNLVAAMLQDDPSLASLDLLTTDVDFPNTVTLLEGELAEVFFPGAAAGDVVMVSSGRFPIGPGTDLPGELFVLNAATGERISVSGPYVPKENEWYYFAYLFYDVNRDGRLDIVATRQVQAERRPPFGFLWNQLLWFEQPADPADARSGSWPARILTNEQSAVNVGPEAAFDFADLDNDGVPELVACEFWGQRLAIYWPENGDWTDASSIRQYMISTELGRIYGVQVIDVNGDGKLDIVATNHVMDADERPPNPVLAAVDLPADWKNNTNQPSVVHVIDDQFFNFIGPNTFVPGYALAFRTADSGRKPAIALAGDGGGEWWLYSPANDDPADWSFVRQSLDTNQCDFIKPQILPNPYQPGTSVVVCGCLGQGLFYGGLVAA